VYKRVLVPLDGSTIALQVLPYAKMVATSTGASIGLIQALNPYPSQLLAGITGYTDRQAPPDTAENWEKAKTKAHETVKAHLEDAASQLRAEGFTVNTTVVEGDPADQIVAEAEKDSDTIVAISTHGRSGVGRWVLGSVTDKVIRQSKNPVLVVRAREGEVTSAAPKLKQVILPLDGSERSSAAMDHAVTLAKALGTGMTLLRSISPMAYGDTFADYVPTMYEDLAGEIEADVKDYLSHEAEELRKAGITNVVEKAIDGYPATAILDEVGEAGDSLVVMATHARGGIGRLVLGSVTDRVVRHSSGPVLVVHPNHD
jgi:nucleotide-binding universal stress UspA family protein